jgi:hypothetical protein
VVQYGEPLSQTLDVRALQVMLLHAFWTESRLFEQQKLCVDGCENLNYVMYTLAAYFASRLIHVSKSDFNLIEKII